MSKIDAETIISITTSLTPKNDTIIFGLGSRGSVYMWSYDMGCWLPFSKPQVRVQETVPIVEKKKKK